MEKCGKSRNMILIPTIIYSIVYCPWFLIITINLPANKIKKISQLN